MTLRARALNNQEVNKIKTTKEIGANMRQIWKHLRLRTKIITNLYLVAALAPSPTDFPPSDSTLLLDRVHISLKSPMRTDIYIYRWLSILLIAVVGVLHYAVAVGSHSLTNIQSLNRKNHPSRIFAWCR